ncbi:MAG: hypothetical protein ACXU82_21115 [Caulobacteraceae bacterium]
MPPHVGGWVLLLSAGASAQPHPAMTVDPLPSARTVLADHALVRVLHQAGVSRTDLIHVAGPGSLPALLWLCRQGYARVQHLQAQSPRCAIEAADALLIPHLSEACGLTSILPFDGCVREGGVLVLRTGARFRLSLAAVDGLAERGFQLEQTACDTGHALYIARRDAVLPARKVA